MLCSIDILLHHHLGGSSSLCAFRFFGKRFAFILRMEIYNGRDPAFQRWRFRAQVFPIHVFKTNDFVQPFYIDETFWILFQKKYFKIQAVEYRHTWDGRAPASPETWKARNGTGGGREGLVVDRGYQRLAPLQRGIGRSGRPGVPVVRAK